MATLFEDLDRRASAAVESVRRGERVAFRHGASSSLVVAELVELLGAEAVAIRVPSMADGYAFAALAAAMQCDDHAATAVADALQSPSDPARAAELLRRALEDRPLVVEHADTIGPVEWRELLRPAAEPLVHMFTSRANVLTGARGELVSAAVPREDARWDSAAMWSQCGRDVETFTLAAARALLTGTNDHRTWDASEIAYEIWSAAPDPMSDLMGALAVHGRPLDRRLVAHLGIATDARTLTSAIDDALRFAIVEQRAGQLALHPILVRGCPLSPLERRTRHRRLADRFAGIVSDRRLGPVSALEAHRHYCEIPDLDRATQFARFGAESLLGVAQRLSKEGRADEEQYRAAARTYQIVLDLDRKLVTPSDLRGIGARPRAYATHYAAFNRYKAGADSIDGTLRAYEEALGTWPENALFWSRYVVGLFVAGRPREAMSALDQAYRRVEEHPQRDSLLIERTVDRLMRRGLLLAARVVEGEREPRPLLRSQVDQLQDSLAKGAPTRVVWSRSRELHLTREITVRIQPAPPFEATLPELGVLAKGASASEALEKLAEALFHQVDSAVTNARDSEAALHYAELLDVERLARQAEQERWLRYLLELAKRQAAGEVTAVQRSAVLGIWSRARERFPHLRRPAAGTDDSGRVHLAWAYDDMPGHELTIEIERDGSLDWFYRDAVRRIAVGSEHPVAALPDDILRHLAAFAR